MMEGVYYSNNPFTTVQEILEQDIKMIIVDFHVQSTGEKFNMGYFLDGKVSVCYGTLPMYKQQMKSFYQKGQLLLQTLE